METLQWFPPFLHFCDFLFSSLEDEILPKRDGRMDGWMDGWMDCGFTSFSTVFQSYQDNGGMIMKGCMQWNPVYDRKDLRRTRDR